MLLNREREPSEGLTVEIIEQSDKAPVTVSQVKGYLNYTGSGQDGNISRFILSALRQVETYLYRTIVKKTYQASYSYQKDYSELPYGPIIGINSVVSTKGETSTTYTSDQYYLNKDLLTTSVVYNTSTYGIQGHLDVEYTAGHLIPVTVASNVITLSGHGYANGDLKTFTGLSITEGKRYVVADVTTDTFTLTDGGNPVSITDGEGFLGLLDDYIKEAIIMQAAENFLRGEASAGLTNKVKQHLRLKQQIMYS